MAKAFGGHPRRSSPDYDYHLFCYTECPHIFWHSTPHRICKHRLFICVAVATGCTFRNSHFGIFSASIDKFWCSIQPSRLVVDSLSLAQPAVISYRCFLGSQQYYQAWLQQKSGWNRSTKAATTQLLPRKQGDFYNLSVDIAWSIICFINRSWLGWS